MNITRKKSAIKIDYKSSVNPSLKFNRNKQQIHEKRINLSTATLTRRPKSQKQNIVPNSMCETSKSTLLNENEPQYIEIKVPNIFSIDSKPFKQSVLPIRKSSIFETPKTTFEYKCEPKIKKVDKESEECNQIVSLGRVT